MSKLILTPDDPGFHEILYTAPPPDIHPTETCLPYVVGLDGIPRAVADDQELTDYLLGGEYDEMMELYGEPDSASLEGFD